ncbi:Site-specific recombinase XerC [Bergeriella denitrificans]|nr:tyrosine-type recombinase/integrase [Bergeriella denitrificans]STZ83006.1 Site-specific recombinase XerC [Bergeriella denitrificans]
MRARTRSRKYSDPVTYYFYDAGGQPRKEIPLGTDYVLAVKKWAELETKKQVPAVTFNQLAARYIHDIINSGKTAPSTAKRYQAWLKPLQQFFGNPDAPLNKIHPSHISQYLQWRKDTPTTANNEISLFTIMWNYGRELGYTNQASPAQGVKKHTLKGRKDVYIEDHIYKFVYSHADETIRDLMDLAYITGQRPIDLVKIHSHHIHDGILHITQQKTGAKLRFHITGDLADIINKRNTGSYLFHNSQGAPLTRKALTERWVRLRHNLIARYPEMAKDLESFQFRDLRAKAGTDIYLSSDADTARAQLGHTSTAMTKQYIRKDKVLEPLKRK